MLVGLLVSLIGFAAAPQGCLACSCALPAGPAEARDQAAAVFRGRVLAIERKRNFDGSGYQRVTLQVNTAWKGTVARETTVYTGSGGVDCGYTFQEGEDYLVYAFSVGATGSPQAYPQGALTTALCNLTKPFAEAGADLAVLGPGAPPPGAPLPNLPNTGEGPPSARAGSPGPAPLALAFLAALIVGTGTLGRRTE